MQENGSDFTLSKPTEGVKLSGAAAGGATVNGSTLWRHPLGGYSIIAIAVYFLTYA